MQLKFKHQQFQIDAAKAVTDAFRSRKPIDVIASTKPILIIDEPQSVLGADRNNATRTKLKEFKPLFTLLLT